MQSIGMRLVSCSLHRKVQLEKHKDQARQSKAKPKYIRQSFIRMSKGIDYKNVEKIENNSQELY